MDISWFNVTKDNKHCCKYLCFPYFVIEFGKLGELGEFNWNQSSMTEGD